MTHGPPKSGRRTPDRRLTIPALITIVGCGAMLGVSIAMSGYWSLGKRTNLPDPRGVSLEQKR